jgi:hypothetical protein
MAAHPLITYLILTFRGRNVAVFRQQCLTYEVSLFLLSTLLPVVPFSSGCQTGLIPRTAAAGYHRGRTAQFSTPARCSRGRYRPLGGNPRLSRDGQGRTVSGNLADCQRLGSHGDGCSRIWCVPGVSVKVGSY